MFCYFLLKMIVNIRLLTLQKLFLISVNSKSNQVQSFWKQVGRKLSPDSKILKLLNPPDRNCHFAFFKDMFLIVCFQAIFVSTETHLKFKRLFYALLPDLVHEKGKCCYRGRKSLPNEPCLLWIVFLVHWHRNIINGFLKYLKSLQEIRCAFNRTFFP